MTIDQNGELDLLEKCIKSLENDEHLADAEKIANLKNVLLTLLKSRLSQADDLDAAYHQVRRA